MGISLSLIITIAVMIIIGMRRKNARNRRLMQTLITPDLNGATANAWNAFHVEEGPVTIRKPKREQRERFPKPTTNTCISVEAETARTAIMHNQLIR